MKKLQLIAVLILSLFFVASCVSDDDDDFWGDDQSDTYSGGNYDDNTDTSSDTIPDNQQDSDTDADTNTDTGTTNTDTSTDSDTDTDADTNTDTGTTDTDTDADTSTDTDTNTDTDTDTGTTDTDADTDTNTDTGADTGADTGDTGADTGDTDTDTDTGSEQPGGLPECSSADVTPCVDSSSTYIWSRKSSDATSWDNANSFCNGLSDGGFNWRMPEIYELRTLIKNCSGSQSSNISCQITDECYESYACLDGCSECSATSSGTYSKLGDSDTLWSASILSSNYAWVALFSTAYFDYGKQSGNTISPANKYKVRCIKK